MARKRFIPTSTYALQTTKGHSSLRQRHYGPAFHRRPVDDLYMYEAPFRHRPSLHPFDTSTTESQAMRDVNRELILSSSALEDTSDIAAKSRNRDREVLSAATRAIVDTELHTSPRYAVAARRAQRGAAKPVVYSAPLNVHRKESGPASSKVIRDVDGLAKPKNVLSWQYKLDALANPDDLLYVPRSLNTVRSRVLEAKEKMDRHKQLLERYLPSDDGLSLEDRRVLERIKASSGSRE